MTEITNAAPEILGQDLTGMKFGMWTAVQYVGSHRWVCQCDCGTQRPVFKYNLTSGSSKSCGCFSFCDSRPRKDSPEDISRKNENISKIPRRCKSCRSTMPIEKFRLRIKKSGIKYWNNICRDCESRINVIENRIWALKNPDEYKIKNKENYFNRKYGITLHYLNEIKAKSGNKCSICDGRNKIMHVDHDHKSGKIRGYLCINCNTAIGSFRDNIGLMKKAISYLENQWLYSPSSE